MAFDQTQPQDFEEVWYLARYRDVAIAVEEGRLRSGLEHYLNHGKAEGRFPSSHSEASALRGPAAAGNQLEDALSEAVHQSFGPLLQKYLADHAALLVESLAPQLRALLDEKLPAILEGAVRAELERSALDGKPKRQADRRGH